MKRVTTTGAGLWLAALLAMAGCFGHNSESDVASSGNPEADQRANQRVGTDKAASNQKERTLYERIGGAETINALVDDMVARSMADPRVNFERRGVKTNWLGKTYHAWQPTDDNVARLKQHFAEFLTVATGGPAQYTGRDVRETHEGMRITNTEFDAMIGDIKTSMDRLGLGAREKRDLLAVFETTRKEIVEK
jgi:hemoglobin